MLFVLSFEHCYLSERLGHWFFEVIARSEGSEEPFEVQLGYSRGTAAFAYMYSGLDLACRGRSRICSCLFVLDVSVIFVFWF